MKSKVIAVVSAAVIAVGSMGAVAFAANAGTGGRNDIQSVPVNQESSGNIVRSVKLNVQTQAPEVESNAPNPNSANNPSKDERKDMIKIMRDNGFKDAARYMQTGDYQKMNEFMNNLSEEDFQKMIEIMKDNGYESMAQMMESAGREGMIQMHNSMGSMHAGGSGMMGGITSAE
jgi:hypothetical protein